MEDQDESENTPALLAERYAESVAYLRELHALPLNHQRQHELFHHVFPDMVHFLQIPHADKFLDCERVQAEMLAILSLDELEALTHFLYSQFVESWAVAGLIDRNLDRFPEFCTREIRKLTRQISGSHIGRPYKGADMLTAAEQEQIKINNDEAFEALARQWRNPQTGEREPDLKLALRQMVYNLILRLENAEQDDPLKLTEEEIAARIRYGEFPF